eukprot:3773602-Alexandrium_andersonii.AAC.1
MLRRGPPCSWRWRSQPSRPPSPVPPGGVHSCLVPKWAGHAHRGRPEVAPRLVLHHCAQTLA